MADDVFTSEVFTPGLGTFQTKGNAKLLNIIFIVDVSGSMRNEGRIDAVNEAFTQMIPALRQIQMDSQTEFELKIAIMTFDQNARWIVNPTPIMEYNHNDIDCSQWVTYFSAAFNKLGEKLTRKEFMAHTGKIAQPYIMLMTDGEPTPNDNYEPVLNKLLENGWFKASQRFAVLIGKDAINSLKARRAVSKFVTSEEEGIINAADAAAIAAEVQAKTIITIQIATKHAVPTFDGDGSSSGSNSYSLGSGFGTGDNSGDGDGFGGFSGFDGFDDGSFI